MKLLVFAQTPPPFHGQSYMTELMLSGLRESIRSGNAMGITSVVHVDAKLSSSGADIGKWRAGKVLSVVRYCFAALFLRLTGRADALYYVPAPGKRAAVYRDWLVLLVCRALFRRTIFHWHAVGLGEWIERDAAAWERWISLRLLGRVDLSVVLSEFAQRDAARLRPRKLAVVANGIPDPCPDFDGAILPLRRKRLEARQRFISGDRAEPIVFRAVFLAACTADKGLFAALEAVALANHGSGALPVQLEVAGEFVSDAERLRFEERIRQPDLEGRVAYRGFLATEEKRALLIEADALVFPSIYPHEGQPISIIEALAFGLRIIATAWRGIPELLAATQSCLVEDQNPTAIAECIRASFTAELTTCPRDRFIERYRTDRFIDALTAAFEAI